MTAVLAACLGLLSQDSHLDETIRRYAQGDDAARAGLVKEGLHAILPVRKFRAGARERIDPLLFELKTSAGGVEARILEVLKAKQSVDLEKEEFRGALYSLFSGPISLLMDPKALLLELPPMTLKMEDRPLLEILEELCWKTGLDFGFFYGGVLIAAPERLWPGRAPAPPPALTQEETERARVLIDQLNSEKVEDRGLAEQELRRLGPALVPVLEAAAQRREAEIAGRCRDLIRVLRVVPAPPVFHASGLSRQTLQGADAELGDLLRGSKVSIKVQDIIFSGYLTLLLRPRNVPFGLGPEAPLARLTVDVMDASLEACLSLTCHAYGLDFMVADGKVLVDTRENVERRLAPAERRR